MSQFEREDRYLVFKYKDMEKYLTADEMISLERTAVKLTMKRIMDGKPRLECVLVESDWPEYEPVWKMLEERMSNE